LGAAVAKEPRPVLLVVPIPSPGSALGTVHRSGFGDALLRSASDRVHRIGQHRGQPHAPVRPYPL